MRYPQGSIHHLLLATTAAVFSFQVDSAIVAADDTATLKLVDSAAPHARRLEVTYDEVMLADAGVLKNKIKGRETKNTRILLRSENRKRVVQETANMFTSLSSSEQQWTSSCPVEKGYIDCKDGFLASNSSQSCKDACDGLCCRGNNRWFPVNGYFPACDGFTGKVCKDSSCSGAAACSQATLPYVVNSCTFDYACRSASTSGSMVNSCGSSAACSGFGLSGVVGNVTDSCNYGYVCMNLGRNGSVANVQNSCNTGTSSCKNVGREGKVGNVINSCTGGPYPSYACYELGFHGNIGNVVNSCTERFSCNELGWYGAVGSVENSCNETRACEKLGKRGAVGNVINSCTGETACQNGAKGVPSKFGSITGGIENSCNAFKACNSAGKAICLNFQCSILGDDGKSCVAGSCMTFGAGGISSKLNGCCNSNSTCTDAIEASVPMACRPPTKKVRKRFHIFFGVPSSDVIHQHS